MNQALAPCLEVAVMLRIREIHVMGCIPQYIYDEIEPIGIELAHAGDVLLYGGKTKGETAKLFNKLALAIAVTAFQPGGVEIFGFKFEEKLPIPIPNPTLE